MSTEHASAAGPATAGGATRARPGDWLEVYGPAGKPARRGQVLEVLGRPGHEHYLVRWDEKHESIFYPAGGMVVLPHGKKPRRPRSSPSGRIP